MVSTTHLKNIINNHDATGRVAKWGIELAAFDIEYKPRTSIKSQSLDDFIVDWTETAENTRVLESEYWTLHFDGSRALGGSGAGVVLKSPQGDKLFYRLQIHFTATNNIAEYEALLDGISIAKNIGTRRLMCFGDSDLVAQQIYDHCKANKQMVAYKAIVDELSKSFEGFEVQHIPRIENE